MVILNDTPPLCICGHADEDHSNAGPCAKCGGLRCLEFRERLPGLVLDEEEIDDIPYDETAVGR